MVLTLVQTLGIPCTCAWLCNHALTNQSVVREPIYASAIVFVSSYIIASSFALVFSCTLDTLFVCTVRDKAEYQAAFMSERLYNAFGYSKSDRKAARKAKKAKQGGAGPQEQLIQEAQAGPGGER